MTALILFFALLIDAALGEPAALWSRLPHPAALMGRAVAFGERHLNRGNHRLAKGVLALGLGVLAMILTGLAIQKLPFGELFSLVLAAILVAQNSLAAHLRAVAQGLQTSLAKGKESVAMIVGRETAEMDENAVIRATIESGAENFSDGVIAPAFWFLIAGLPGLLVYKLVNTADSMIGYRTPQYEQFGKCAARLDDLLNLVPARLTGLLYVISGLSLNALQVMRRDASLHRSPNAGWPESAMAALLGVAISGPRTYNGQQTSDPFVNAEGRRDLIANDIHAAIAINWRAWVVFTLTIGGIALGSLCL